MDDNKIIIKINYQAFCNYLNFYLKLNGGEGINSRVKIDSGVHFCNVGFIY